MKYLCLFVLLLLPLCAVAMPASEAVTSETSRTRLVADADAVTPGEPFWLALEVQLEPEWHTYWENPGDTGIPTTLTWTLPEGFTAAPVHWPTPERVELAGLMNFAYSGLVYFPAPITPPKDLTDGNYSFTLKADWLVCKDICIPESGEYTLELPIGTASRNETSHLEASLSQLPKPLKATTQYSVSDKELVLTIPTTEITAYQGRTATLFPLTENLIDNMAQQKTEWSDEALTLTIKRGASPETPPLKALLVLEDESLREAVVHSAERPENKAGFILTADVSTAIAEKKLGGVKPPHPDPLPQGEREAALRAAEPAGEGVATLWTALLLAFAGGVILNLMPCVLPILSLKAIALMKKSTAAPREAAAHGVAYTAGIVASFMLIAGALIALQQAGQAVGWGFQLQSPGFVTVLAILTFAVGLNLSGLFTIPHLFGGAGQTLAARHGLPGTFFTGVLAVLVATPCTAPFMAPALGFALTQPALPAFVIFMALALGFAAPLLLVSLSPRLLHLLPRPGAWMHSFKQLMAFPMYATSAWLVVVLTGQGGMQALAEVLTLIVASAFLLWLHEHMKSKLAHKAYHLGLLAFSLFFVWLLISTPGALPDVKEEPFSTSRLETLRAEHTPVFVYATASWCLTCKLNETTSLRTSMVREHFQKAGIVVMKADWTNRDAHISEYLRSFHRQGVPLYVFYPKDGGEPKLLPQLLTPYLLVDETQP